MIQRGTLLVVGGVPFVLGGIMALKLTGIDASWALIALGAVVSCVGGISISLSGSSEPTT